VFAGIVGTRREMSVVPRGRQACVFVKVFVHALRLLSG
jgi:hypothetical protein